MAPTNDTPERRIARLAHWTHGLTRRSDLLDAGITDAQIRTRRQNGLLIPEYPGIFRVGHRSPSIEADYLAAVWACGTDAYLFGVAAVFLYALAEGDQPKPHVAAPTRREQDGIVHRHSRRTDPRDLTTFKRIPITTVARTIVDVVPVLEEAPLSRLCHQAGIRYDLTPQGVEAVLRRRRNAPGSALLHAVLWGEVPITLSELEAAFLALLDLHDLPRPATNRRVGKYRVDCRWEQPRLIVELDGYRFHRSREAWERDRQRERDARMRGYEYRRFSWRDVVEDPRYLLSELMRLLAVSGDGPQSTTT